MDTKMTSASKISAKTIIICIVVCVLLVALSGGVGYMIGARPDATPEPTPEETPDTTPDTPEQTQPAGYAANPAYEYMVASAAWQMSAEAHALMMQGFYLAQKNVDDMASLADLEQDGYRWVEIDGEKKLYRNDKRVCVVCDIDDTLVDGVHYTANILGKDGEWTNKAFTDFVQSAGCTALPGAVAFANHCKQNGVAVFYVTNRYDQGYKLSESGYAGQQGYQKADGTVIGSSTFDIFGKTMYDITMESMAQLGFPTNDPKASNYWADAILIVNDTKLNGSSKEGIRDAIAAGGALKTGERTQESDAYPATVDISSHHIAMLLGDDLNDISQIFSDCENAVDRVTLTIDNMENWGSKWIVFPNAVYGSAANYAAQYGYSDLFEKFDYTEKNNNIWEIYN
jgi:predicted secreted acid phosphatase